MHLYEVAFYAAGTYFAVFVDNRVLIPFFAILVLYSVASAQLKGAQGLSTRKKIMQATWSHPSSPSIYAKIPVRTEKVQKLIASLPKQKKVTLTHFCIKALGQVLVAQPQLNGVITLGKFWPKESVNIGCLVDIEGGKDLTILNINGVQTKSVEEIAEFINSRVRVIKRQEGGQEHKKATMPLKNLPAFVVQSVSKIIFFFLCKLRINMPGMNTNIMGTAGLTSVSNLGFEDSTAPLNSPSHWSLILTVNAITRQPVVEDGKVVIGEVMNCNFVVDHRYVDGGSCSKLTSVFRNVFEDPEKYLQSSNREMKQT